MQPLKSSHEPLTNEGNADGDLLGKAQTRVQPGFLPSRAANSSRLLGLLQTCQGVTMYPSNSILHSRLAQM
jgi:hypothetical protein